LIDEGVDAGRRKLAAMNDGIYRSTIFIDNAGKDKNGLIGCEVEVEKRHDRVTIRFKGSPRVLFGNFNMFPHMMIAMTACYLFQFFFHELPPTTGYYEPFGFEFQEGSFFMADPEDATSLGVGTQAQVITAVQICMEKMKFASPYHDQVVAPWAGTNSVIFAGIGKDGTPTRPGTRASTTAWAWALAGIRMGSTGGFPWCAIGEFWIPADRTPVPAAAHLPQCFHHDASGINPWRPLDERDDQSPRGAGDGHRSFSGISGRPISPGLMGGYPARP
jgi:acetophenone carboxylase